MALVDWKRNNKIALRNFSESNDSHDLVKLFLVRKLRRRYPDSNKYPIYTEFNELNKNESYPDVWMRISNHVYVWEIQKSITEKWKKQILKKYEDVNLIIIDLKEFEKEKDINKIKELIDKYTI